MNASSSTHNIEAKDGTYKEAIISWIQQNQNVHQPTQAQMLHHLKKTEKDITEADYASNKVIQYILRWSFILQTMIW